MAHIAKWKKKKIEELKNLVKQYPVVALADMTNMPSPQLQKMRSSLRNSVYIIMTKGRLIKLMLDQSKEIKKGIEKLEEHIKGMPSLIFTKDNPFKLSKILSKNKTKAPAKPGQLAPNDIKVSAGPTPFAPGPVMGELGQAGIKTTVQEGKIHIKDDVVLVKEGQEISEKVASILSKLKIEPMEIGLNLIAAYEDGLIYTKDVLSIDEQAYINNLKLAYTESLNLSLNAYYPTKENVTLLIKKAYIEGEALLDLSNVELPKVEEPKPQEVKVKEKPKEEPKVEEKQEEQLETVKEEPVEEKPKEEIIVEQKQEQPEPIKEEKPNEEPESPKAEPEVKKEVPKEEPVEENSEEELKKEKEKFEQDQKQAQDILNKLQEEKLKKQSSLPIKKKEEPIKKGPKVEDLVPKE